MAVCLAALVGAAPPASKRLQPTINNVQPASDKLDVASDIQAFNITIPLNNTSADTVKALGLDPSRAYQNWATVEVWTGGHSRGRVNFGDMRNSALSDKVFELLDKGCPARKTASGAGCCQDKEWSSFATNALIKGDPAWTVGLRRARVKTEAACWDNEGIRVLLAQIVADTLRAYTRRAKHHNCYDIPGDSAGTYCNVPRFVRVNLPKHSVTTNKVPWPTLGNFWHIETWGADAVHQFSEFGVLRPCRTRDEVDDVMDKYANDLTGFFPQWKNWFHRDARVIDDGYKVCTNEPL
ncbi:hypothetical protein EKO04_010920 [Ascochyta lentis]|uniref:Uncharacterized protein n=1 Tax=Ascochyta lentis TaxID=205686 RepID=A0A8H7ME25_9PLEO|nr:hypothetical protein EKO04_010920 [Ascochyta lentis]